MCAAVGRLLILQRDRDISNVFFNLCDLYTLMNLISFEYTVYEIVHDNNSNVIPQKQFYDFYINFSFKILNMKLLHNPCLQFSSIQPQDITLNKRPNIRLSM